MKRLITTCLLIAIFFEPAFVQMISADLSLQSNDELNKKDLAVLRDAIGNKRIVMLGEFSHGVKEINTLKINVIKYLHEQMGFNVLVFESDLGGMIALNSLKYTPMTYDKLIFQGLPMIWYTDEYKAFMKYVKDNKDLHLAGIDPQFQTSNTRYFLNRLFKKIDSLAGGKIFNVEQSAELFLRKIRDTVFLRSVHYVLTLDSCLHGYEEAKNIIAKYQHQLPVYDSSAQIVKFLNKMIDTRIAVLKYTTKYLGVRKDQSRARDSVMALNFAWLAQEIFPNEKIIVSAHNYHIAKLNDEIPVMGSIFTDPLAKQIYVVGFYGLNGQYGDNSGNPVALEIPSRNSMRNYLKNVKRQVSFYDLKMTRPQFRWFNQPVEVEGYVNYSGSKILTPSKSFDAIFVIKDISVPRYLYK
jgi:erythromycin esterase